MFSAAITSSRTGGAPEVARISVIINTCNEAHHLEACIASVRPLADEIIVCDMESSDGSADLARELGCKVVTHRKMEAPEPEARLAAIEAASGDWIRVFDPDMRLKPDTCRRLRDIAESDEADIVEFHCHNRFLGRWCPHGHGSQGVFRKFFHKRAFSPRAISIHTFWHDSLKGRVVRLGRRDAIEHLAYESTLQLTETLGRYARREARDAWEHGVPPSVFRMVWKPLKRFMGNYIFRLGFLDGVPGLIVNAAVSGYLFLIEAHLWDISRISRRTIHTPGRPPAGSE